MPVAPFVFSGRGGCEACLETCVERSRERGAMDHIIPSLAIAGKRLRSGPDSLLLILPPSSLLLCTCDREECSADNSHSIDQHILPFQTAMEDKMLSNLDSQSENQRAEEDENTHPKRQRDSAGDITNNAEGNKMSQGMKPAACVQSTLVRARKERHNRDRRNDNKRKGGRNRASLD